MNEPLRRFGRVLADPFVETFDGLERCLDGGGRQLVVIMAALLVGWWVYVPLHELLHALGCLLSGGEVTRLEIGVLYGGSLFERLIPWVVSGSDYAGRLSGFSTHGNDFIYLATDLAPYLLTLWPGLWAMRLGVRKGWSWLYGFMLPWALAPFISLTGDAYEIGSILLTWLPPWSSEAMRTAIRGDDIFLLPARLQAEPGGVWLGAGLALVVGLAWAYAWYGLSSITGRALGQGRLEAAEQLAATSS